MPSRRDYLDSLGSLGSALGLAGCLGDEPTATETTRSPTRTATPEAHSFGSEATVGGVTVTPSNVHPQSSVFWISNVDWGDVVRLDDEWVVLVNLSVSGDSETAPPRDAFSLVVRDTSFVARERLGEAPLHLVIPDDAVEGSAYGLTDRPKGWLAFTVPAEFDSASELALQVEHEGNTARWSLPDETTERIAGTRPTFEVVSFDVPERVPLADATEVAVTARNTSDVDGVFRGCVNTSGMYSFHEVGLPIEAGAEATWTERLRVSHYAPGGGTFACYLRAAGDDERKRTVEVVADDTPTATATAREQS